MSIILTSSALLTMEPAKLFSPLFSRLLKELF